MSRSSNEELTVDHRKGRLNEYGSILGVKYRLNTIYISAVGILP